MVAAISGAAMLAVASRLGTILFGRKASTEAYRIGAEGERRAARDLAKLDPQRWTVLHDRRAGSRDENIDHLVVGPAGVVVVETKNWKGKVKVEMEGLRSDGGNANDVLDQAERQVRAVRQVTDRLPWPVVVSAVIYLPRADVVRAGSRKHPARPRGIRVAEPRHLIAAVTDGEDALTSDQVDAVAAALREQLRPA